MQPPKGYCIYCGKKANSKEHLYAAWLEAYVPHLLPYRIHFSSENIIDFRKRVIVTGPVKKSIKPGSVNSHRLKIVCRECNGGWMGKLQERAKPHIIKLLQNDWSISSPESRNSIAAWATMFVMNVEFKDRKTVCISTADRAYLMKNGAAPRNWGVAIGIYNGSTNVGFSHVPLKIIEHEKEGSLECWDKSATDVSFQAQYTVFIVGSLIFLTFSARHNHYQLFNLFHDICHQYDLYICTESSNVPSGIPLTIHNDDGANEISKSFLPPGQRKLLRNLV